MSNYSLICQYAQQRNNEKLEDILSNGNGVSIDEVKFEKGVLLTPAGLLAAEGKDDAWGFLLEYGAATHYIVLGLALSRDHEKLYKFLKDDSSSRNFENAAYGLALGGHIVELNKFLQANSADANIKHAAKGLALGGDIVELYKLLEVHAEPANLQFAAHGLALGGHIVELNKFIQENSADANIKHAAKGLAENGYTHDQESIKYVLALILDQSNRRKLADEIVKKQPLIQGNIQTILKSAHEIAYLMNHAQLSYDQACAWERIDAGSRTALLQSVHLSLGSTDGPINVISSFLTGLPTAAGKTFISKTCAFIKDKGAQIREKKLSDAGRAQAVSQLPQSLFKAIQPNPAYRNNRRENENNDSQSSRHCAIL